MTVISVIPVIPESQSRLKAGAQAEVREECCWLVCSPRLAPPRTPYLSRASTISNELGPPTSTISLKKMPHKLADKPVWWMQFLSSDSSSQTYLGVYYADKNQPALLPFHSSPGYNADNLKRLKKCHLRVNMGSTRKGEPVSDNQWCKIITIKI